MKIAGTVAIITGASSGFGRELARRLTSMGGSAVLADMNEKAGVALANELNEKYKKKVAVFAACDVTNFAQLQNLFDVAKREFGHVEIMVNNAGIGELAPLDEDTKGLWKKVVDIDLNAVIEGTRIALVEFSKISQPSGSEGSRGVIINTASMAGIYASHLTPVYSAAKFGVVGFTKSFKPLDKVANIRVNAVAPYYSDTNIVKEGMASRKEFQELMGTVEMVPVPLVIDAFIRTIEDESLSGDVLRVNSKGISVDGQRPKKPAKL